MIIDMSNLQRVHKSGDSASRLCCQERAHLLKRSIATSGLCLAGIGEILMDRFDSGAVTLGGAPFNLTFHLHQLLAALDLGETAFVSAVGEDAPGDDIRSQVTQAGMSPRYLTVDQSHPTGAARVFETPGEAGFEILQDVAWDYLRASPELDALAERSQAVVFGSLAQRSATSRATIRNFVSRVDGTRLYDVNLRRNTTDGVAGYSAEIIAESLALATVVKMNDAELEEIAGMLGFHAEDQEAETQSWNLMGQFLRRYDLTAITVTRGSHGALLMGGEKRLKLADSTLPPESVHPVGAGDSFAAGVLFGMVQNWRLEDCLRLAEILSIWVVSHISATPRMTSEVLASVKELAERATASCARRESR